MTFPFDTRHILQEPVKALHGQPANLRFQIFHFDPIPKGFHVEAGQHSFVRHPSARYGAVVRCSILDVATTTVF